MGNNANFHQIIEINCPCPSWIGAKEYLYKFEEFVGLVCIVCIVLGKYPPVFDIVQEFASIPNDDVMYEYTLFRRGIESLID